MTFRALFRNDEQIPFTLKFNWAGVAAPNNGLNNDNTVMYVAWNAGRSHFSRHKPIPSQLCHWKKQWTNKWRSSCSSIGMRCPLIKLMFSRLSLLIDLPPKYRIQCCCEDKEVNGSSVLSRITGFWKTRWCILGALESIYHQLVETDHDLDTISPADSRKGAVARYKWCDTVCCTTWQLIEPVHIYCIISKQNCLLLPSCRSLDVLWKSPHGWRVDIHVVFCVGGFVRKWAGGGRTCIVGKPYSSDSWTMTLMSQPGGRVGTSSSCNVI